VHERTRRAADLRVALEHVHRDAGPCEAERRDEAYRTCTGDDDVDVARLRRGHRHGSFLLVSTT
jgi:hypothetical protein